jgi:hypothetical protein
MTGHRAVGLKTWFNSASPTKCRGRAGIDATIGRAKLGTFFERGFIPEATDDTATVTFINFEGRTYAVAAKHVMTAFANQAPKDGVGPESYFLPAAKGVAIHPPFVAPPGMWPEPAPDIALRKIDDDLPLRIGKEVFVLRPEVVPTFPGALCGGCWLPHDRKKPHARDPTGRGWRCPACMRSPQKFPRPNMPTSYSSSAKSRRTQRSARLAA